jgi:hypothetical protein
MDQIMGPQFNGTADYDCIVQATFKDIQDFVKMKADPFFKEKVAPDHENFADTVRSKYVLFQNMRIWKVKIRDQKLMEMI